MSNEVRTEGLWRNANFVRLWGATAGANFGDGMVLAAAPLLAATLTRHPALVAGLTVAQRLPWFLFSLPSGALVDRWNRKKVFGFANLFRALMLAVLTISIFLKVSTILSLYVVFFLLGMAETLVDNSALAVLPALVPRSELEKANGHLFATYTAVNEFVGPPVGSSLFAGLTTLPFLVTSVSYGLAALPAFFLTGRFTPASDSAGLTWGQLWHDIHEGLRWFLAHRILRTLGMMAGVVNFFYAATISVFVLFAQDILGLNEVQYGLVLATGAIGGIAGGLAAKRMVGQAGAGWTIFLTNLLPGLAYLTIALTRNAYVVGAMFAVMSFAAMVGNVVLITLRQTIIPDGLLGRVTSAYRLLGLGALPLGAFAGGMLADRLGLVAPYLFGGGLLILMAFALLPVLNNRALATAGYSRP